MTGRLKIIVLALVTALLVACGNDGEMPREVVMYKDAGCDCCGAWAAHMRKEGFTVEERVAEKMAPIKRAHSLTPQLVSCHTALVGGYVIEGHVPADDVKRLLKEKPADIVGLAAPGMPGKSPGMQPEGLPPSGYDVISFTKDGKTAVYSHY